MQSDEYQPIWWIAETRLVSAIDQSIRAQRLKVLLGRICLGEWTSSEQQRGFFWSGTVMPPTSRKHCICKVSGCSLYTRYFLSFKSDHESHEWFHIVASQYFITAHIPIHEEHYFGFDVWSMLTSCYWHIGVWVIRLCQLRACTLHNAQCTMHNGWHPPPTLILPRQLLMLERAPACLTGCPTYPMIIETTYPIHGFMVRLCVEMYSWGRILHFDWIGISQYIAATVTYAPIWSDHRNPTHIDHGPTYLIQPNTLLTSRPYIRGP